MLDGADGQVLEVGDAASAVGSGALPADATDVRGVLLGALHPGDLRRNGLERSRLELRREPEQQLADLGDATIPKQTRSPYSPRRRCTHCSGNWR
jgi:hypothetical protein